MGKWSATASNKAGGDSYAIPPEDNHVAVLVGMVDLGTHTKEFAKDGGGTEERDYRYVFLAWELTDCPDPDHKGHNFIVGKQFSMALGLNAKLRPVVEVALGRKLADGEDVEDISAVLMGSKCLVEIKHAKGKKDTTRTYANLSAITRVPGKTVVPPPKETPFLYSLDDGPFDPPTWLPQWSYGEKLRDIMEASKERGGAAKKADAEEPIPF